jgi:hypothetical protein
MTDPNDTKVAPGEGTPEKPRPANSKQALGLPRWVWAVAIGLVVLSVGFYSWIGATRPEKASWWGVMGDSFALFSALFNAGALLAALWAVHLQRQESHDSQAEFAKQLRELTRSAEAQNKLAESQKNLAEAQMRANIATLQGVMATRAAGQASLYAAVVTAHSALLGTDHPLAGQSRKALVDHVETIKGLMRHEIPIEEDLVKLLRAELELLVKAAGATGAGHA